MSLKLSQNTAIYSENMLISEKHILFALNEKLENNNPNNWGITKLNCILAEIVAL